MQGNSDSEFRAWEWITLVAVAGAAIFATEASGISQKWEDVVVFTAVLFAVVLLTLRELWKAPSFWWNLLPVFALHVIAFAILAEVLPLGRFGFPKIPLTLGCMVEGVLILSVLWRKNNEQANR